MSVSLQEFIRDISIRVNDHITHPPNGANITEWCKKEECWKRLAEIDIPVPNSLSRELISADHADISVDRGLHAMSDEERLAVLEMAVMPAEVWFRISKWAKETGNLQDGSGVLRTALGK